MFSLHFKILDNISKRQKSSLMAFVKNFVKKSDICDRDELSEKIFDELQEEVKTENSLYFWVREYLENRYFQSDIRFLVQKCLRDKKQKQAQAVYNEKRKLYLKEFRRKVVQKRQSHEKPTAKQIKYYKYLCEKSGKTPENTENKSKLDLINLINGIINERST